MASHWESRRTGWHQQLGWQPQGQTSAPPLPSLSPPLCCRQAGDGRGDSVPVGSCLPLSECPWAGEWGWEEGKQIWGSEASDSWELGGDTFAGRGWRGPTGEGEDRQQGAAPTACAWDPCYRGMSASPGVTVGAELAPQAASLLCLPCLCAAQAGGCRHCWVMLQLYPCWAAAAEPGGSANSTFLSLAAA